MWVGGLHTHTAAPMPQRYPAITTHFQAPHAAPPAHHAKSPMTTAAATPPPTTQSSTTTTPPSPITGWHHNHPPQLTASLTVIHQQEIGFFPQVHIPHARQQQPRRCVMVNYHAKKTPILRHDAPLLDLQCSGCTARKGGVSAACRRFTERWQCAEGAVDMFLRQPRVCASSALKQLDQLLACLRDQAPAGAARCPALAQPCSPALCVCNPQEHADTAAARSSVWDWGLVRACMGRPNAAKSDTEQQRQRPSVVWGQDLPSQLAELWLWEAAV